MDRRPDNADMPSESDWLIIPRWGDFQHYGEKRKPIWIKNYTRLLQDAAYLELSPASRALLHGLWLAYANSSGQLQLSQARVSLHLRFGYPQLFALNHAGFLEWSASKPLAHKEEVEVEVEVDKEPPYPLRGKTDKTPDAELLSRALDIAADWAGGTNDEFDAALDDIERQHGRRLPTTSRIDLWNEVIRREKAKNPGLDW